MDQSTRTRIRTGLLLLLLVTASASVWYWWAEELSVIDAVYQTAITISTVGFTELVEFSETTRLVTIGVIMLGAGTTAYTLTALFEQFADERIENARRRRMERSAKGMVDHMIVCGFGRVGSKVAADAASKGGDVVVIESDDGQCQAAADAGLTVIRGSATEDAALTSAGIAEAAVLVAAIDSDAENVYIVLSARAANPDVRIIARATTNESAPKLVQAGADRVINPEDIGASRMLAFAMRPAVSDFLDVMLHGENVEFEMDEAQVTAESDVSNHPLAEAQLRKRTGAVVLAIHRGDGTFDTQPSAETVLEPGMTVIGIGTREQLGRLSFLLAPDLAHERSKRRGEWPYV